MCIRGKWCKNGVNKYFYMTTRAGKSRKTGGYKRYGTVQRRIY